MIETDNYRRFERVDNVEETETGLLGQTHGELMRIDLVRDDVVRVKISRGGAFDEAPTYAVCVDPLAEVPEFSVEREDGVVRVRTSAMVVSLWLDPFRLDVHRTDGSVVVESAQDEEGRYWAYATLNDAFDDPPPACRHEDAIYGLGEKGGHHNRAAATSRSGTPTSSTPTRDREFTRRPAPRATRGPTGRAPSSTPTTSRSRSSTTTTHPAGAMAGSFVDNGYRGQLRVLRARTSTASPSHGGQYTEYVFAGPDDAEHPRGATRGSPAAPRCRRSGRSATTSAAGSPTRRTRSRRSRSATATRASRATRCGSTSTTWTATASSPGTRTRFPDAGGHAEALGGDRASGSITIVDPGVKHDPGYAVFDEALERDVLCRTEGGDIYIGQVWPGNTAFPDFATPEARAWWGELNAAHVESGLAGIWNDMNEPATGEIAAAGDALRPGPRLARALPQPVRAAHGDGHAPRGCARPMPERADVRPVPGRLRRHPALRRELDGRQPGALGPPVGQHADGDAASASRASPSSAPTSAASRATPTPSSSCAGCSTAR